MNKIILLALSAGALLCATPVFAEDASGYKSLTDHASTDYKTALARCNEQTAHARKVCREEAKLARAKADADAVAQHRNTPREVSKARAAVANAEYDLAKAECAEHSGADRGSCLRDAKSARVAALSDVRSGTQTAGTGNASNASGEMRNQAGTGTAILEDCDRMNAADKTACVARRSSGKAMNVIADTVITTKVKADLVKEPDLKAMDVHVETVNGVVMLSGFVPSETQASKAVELARSVEGVHDVKSALKVTR